MQGGKYFFIFFVFNLHLLRGLYRLIQHSFSTHLRVQNTFTKHTFFCIKIYKLLHMSKKSSTFVPKLREYAHLR